MSAEAEILALQRRITELERQVEFLYKHLGIYQLADTNSNAQVIEALKQGNKLEAIMLYRSTHDVSLAEAKRRVDELESKSGLE